MTKHDDKKPKLLWPMNAHRLSVTLPCDDYAPRYDAGREVERHAKNAILAVEQGIAELRRCTSTGEKLLAVAKAVAAVDRHLWGVGRNCPVRQAQVRAARDAGKHEADPVNTERLARVNNLGGRKPH